MSEHRILVVEDEEGIALHIQFMLKKMGYHPLGPLASGQQAIQQAGELRPDLVLMDINLADGQTGIFAAREINSRYNIPVIFLSGAYDEDALLDIRDSNPYAYLLKPVQQRELLAAIELAIYKHEMERRLHESESRYHRLFETMNAGLALFDVLFDETGQVCDYRLVDVNPALQQLMHMQRDSVVGRCMSEFFDVARLKPFLALYSQILANGAPVNMEAFEPTYARYLDVRAYSPGPDQLAMLINDITERRRTEQVIAESELRFRQMAETVNEVFWLSSRPDSQMLYINPAYERIWDRPTQEVYSSPQAFLNCVHPDDQARVNQAQTKANQNGAHFDEEFRIVRPDGSLRWVWARTYPVPEADGQIHRYSGIAEDITERKLASQELLQSYRLTENALRRMTVLRNMGLAITTHTDLRTMIKTVLELTLGLEEVDAALMFYPEQGLLSLAGAAGVSQDVLSPAAVQWMGQEAERVFRSGLSSIQNDAVGPAAHSASTGLPQALPARLGFHGFSFLPLHTKGQVKGVLLLLCRTGSHCTDETVLDFFQSLALQAAIAIDNVELFRGLKRSNAELRRAYDDTIKGWAEALELRSADTRGHCDRVVQLSERLARAMGMSEEELVHFRRGVMLHDIGKLGIPDRILLKSGRLNEEEWEAIHRHPVYGYQMLRDIEYLRPAIDVPYCHHERWDGTGYPRGLSGEDIPRAARIFSVVDVWDALIHERPYHPSWQPKDAIAYITSQSGRQFDPEVVQAFLSLVKQPELDALTL